MNLRRRLALLCTCALALWPAGCATTEGARSEGSREATSGVASAGAQGESARDSARALSGSAMILPGNASATPSSSPALTAGDLWARLQAVAHDSMLGREAGKRGNWLVTRYLADRARMLGLQPAGEGGTYFQTVPLTRRVYDERSSLSVEGTRLVAWEDFLPRDPGPDGRTLAPERGGAPEGVQAIYGGQWGDEGHLIPAERARGKLVVVAAPRAAGGVPQWAVSKSAVSSRFPDAAGIALANLDPMPAEIRGILREPPIGLAAGHLVHGEPPSPEGPPAPAFAHVTLDTARRILGAPIQTLSPGTPGRLVTGRIEFRDEQPEAPARNVVAVLPGSDPALRGQYVAIGAHNDHVGVAPQSVGHDSLRTFNRVVRPGGLETPLREPTAAEGARIRAELDSLRTLRPERPDSIYNGADDDGSGTVAVLEIAEALARGNVRPRRSVLFVWHTAEELGLLGAQWFTDRPTVPRDSIVAQINIDMIGRGRAEDVEGGGPGYLQLIGSRRLSTELGGLVEAVNRGHGLRFDYEFDADGHPQNYYCRSDHYMYARYGIPIVFFTTGGHRDYHQVTDEPQYVDYRQLERVAGFIRDVVLAVANLDHRPVVDKPKPDPHAPCQQ